MASEQDKLFARKATESRLVTKEAVSDCLNIQKRLVEMGLLERPLKEILVEKGYLSEEDAARIDGAKEQVQKVVRVGGYEVLSRLGKGQMGRVYKARQISTDRIVALKVLPSSLSKDRNYLERFIREAKAAAKLNHPNVVSALEFGESDGLYYYAMEYVEGANVRTILEQEGKIDEREALAIVFQIAQALEHAHSLSIIHRDIKPENVMVMQDGTAKLCDLGLAREATEDSSLTQFGAVLGTPYYISPKQARGEKNLDIRTDIYSLGVTLFHMVTGQVPFTGTSIATIMAKHITEEPPSASAVEPQVSLSTSRLVRKMMEKNPGRRHQNPAELIEEINRIISGASVSVPPRKTAPRRLALRKEAALPSPAKRAVPVAAFAIAVVILILIVVIVSLSSRGPGKEFSEEASAPPRPSEVETLQPRRAEHLTPPPLREEQPREQRVSESQERLREIAQFAKDNPSEVVRIAGKYREFIETEYDSDALKKAQGALESLAAKNFISLQSEVSALSLQGDYRGAIDKVVEFEKIFEKTQSALRAAELKNSLTESMQAVFAAGLKEAKELMEKGEFEKSQSAVSALIPPAQKERDELENFSRKLKAKMKSAHKKKLAKINDTRDAFFAEVKKLAALFQFSKALSRCEERLEIEEESEPRSRISDLKRDLEVAASVLERAKESLSKMVGSRIVIRLKKGSPAQGELKEVAAESIILENESAKRSIPFTEFAQEEFVRLVELTGQKNADTYIALGTFLLLACEDSESAQKMFEKAKGLGGGDVSQLGGKVQSAQLKEKLQEAESLLGAKKYIEAAKAFSLILSGLAGTESLKEYREQLEQKIELALSESGVRSVFKGKVSVAAGKFTVTYDFSDAKQLEDFSDYIWSEKIEKRESQWVVTDGVLAGRGAEGVLWKGVIKGDVALEVTAKPISPQEACFYLRLCDDGKGAEGRNYSFGFGFKQPIIRYVRKGRQAVAEIVGYEPQENLIAKLKSGKFSYLKSKIAQPTIRAGETYKVRIEREGERLRSFADDSPVADVKDSDFTKGAVSLKVVSSEVHFDDMKITGDFDPTHLAKAIKEASRR
jgi:serine/threonine-protein kinase